MADPPAGFSGDPLLDEQIVRNRIAADARKAVNTGSTGSEERQDEYADRLFPNTPNARLRAQMADEMYSCGLSGLAAMRASLIDAIELHEDYATHVGEALAWLASIAQRMNAYVPLGTRAQCDAAGASQSGDILVVDGPVHVIVLTDRTSDVIDGDTSDDFITSEGGKPEVDPHTGEHGMSIHARRMRTRRTDAGRIQTGTVNADGSVTWGRIAIYRIDAGMLRRTDEV